MIWSNFIVSWTQLLEVKPWHNDTLSPKVSMPTDLNFYALVLIHKKKYINCLKFKISVSFMANAMHLYSVMWIKLIILRLFFEGRQHTIFNSHSKIQVGGKFNPIKNRIERPFQGVISGVVFGGNRILDMAAEDDPRVSVQGDVELLITIPPGGQTVAATADSEEVSNNLSQIG